LQLSDEEISKRALATVANYEGNLRIIEALGNAYGFKAYAFWQPCLLYGSKPAIPFERVLAHMRSGEFERVIVEVYDEAKRRAATGAFVFLGGVFDQVTEPLYVDWNMHLCPLGNQIVALAIARTIEDGGLKAGR
jgi:hypothetical protein